MLKIEMNHGVFKELTLSGSRIDLLAELATTVEVACYVIADHCNMTPEEVKESLVHCLLD